MSASPSRPLVVIVGMGETGVLTALNLNGCDVVGVATKQALVSGQEVGLRLVAPGAWKKDHVTDLGRFKRLKHVTRLIGRAVSVDVEKRRLVVELAGGGRHVQPYDYLVIASGITNGFWRDDKVVAVASIERDIEAQAKRLAAAETIAVVGGGPTGTSIAANLAIRYKRKAVHLFHSGDLPLPGYDAGVRKEIVRLLDSVGVRRAGGHRAELDGRERAGTLDGGTVQWRTGQPPFEADAIVWATGASHPNSGFLPPHLLDEAGFVLTEPTLQVRGCRNIFAIGDVAQTDEHRSSARNSAYRLLAGNIAALDSGHPERMMPYLAPRNRWGSIIGTQKEGLTVYLPDGGKMRMARWYVRLILYPFKVRRGIYGGVRSRLWHCLRGA
ncbi:MAG: FAD-dependent oxidoreductase [Sphingomonas sp.]